MKNLVIIISFLSLLSCAGAPPSGRKLSASEIQAHGFTPGQEHLKCDKDAAQTETCRKFVCTNPAFGDFECYDQEASEEDKTNFRRQLNMKVAGAATDNCQFVESGSQVSCSSSSLEKEVRTRVICVGQNETKAPRIMRGTCAFEECSGPELKTCSRKGNPAVLQWKPDSKK
jgi:hypothetical protein